ncbi:hypothetical protein Tco_1294285 [Tanacetum coccineum]
MGHSRGVKPGKVFEEKSILILEAGWLGRDISSVNNPVDVVARRTFLDGKRKVVIVKFSGEVVDLTGDEDPTDEDVYIGLGDSTGVLAPSGDEISLGGKKLQESDIGGGTICNTPIFTYSSGS